MRHGERLCIGITVHRLQLPAAWLQAIPSPCGVHASTDTGTPNTLLARLIESLFDWA